MTSRPMLILVAGGPGAGKTTFGRALARRLREAILLDKDVIASVWVDAMLESFDGGRVDRDSAFYWNTVRALEYGALMATALDNLVLGKSVIAVAPFGPELRDSAWIDRCRQSLMTSQATLHVVWLVADAIIARDRMQLRGDARDGWKLANWDEFAACDRFGAPPGNWIVLRNDAGSRIDELVDRVMAEL